MYTTHFDLKGRLFATGIAQDDAWFVDERAADDVLPPAVALSAPDSVLVLLGPPGVGKTAFAAHALRATTGGMRCAVAWIATPPATAHELLELLLAEFGFEPYRQSRAERVQTWRQFLMELGATETRVFVALERAHDFEPAVLSALDALTTADPNACPGASLVPMGTEALGARLEDPSLEPLRQRVRLVRRLHPLDAAGVGRYLEHAAARAGSSLERLFTAEAVAALAGHSRGIPRLVNHIAEGALALAALRGGTCVDDSTVAAVAAAIAGAAQPMNTAALKDETRNSASDDIPVLTEYVEGEAEAVPAGDDLLDPLDGAATMTLLGDELDAISAEIAAEMLEADAFAGEAGGDDAAAVPPDAGNGLAGAVSEDRAARAEAAADGTTLPPERSAADAAAHAGSVRAEPAATATAKRGNLRRRAAG